MNCCVVIPTTKSNYEQGFSAPLAWLFSGYENRVRGIYSVDLTPTAIGPFDTFIIELNWFTTLHEFGKIVSFIREHQPRAVILFGGLFAQIHYRRIFQEYEVDYFIRGDNELPIKLFLEGCKPSSIPNIVGRDFENPIDYRFSAAEFERLEYSLDWFPDYGKYPRYRDSLTFPLPMLLTSKGGCCCIHSGCQYCLGSQTGVLESAYGREPIAMGQRTLMGQLSRLSARFRVFSLYVLTPFSYDFAGQFFDATAMIEIDSPVSLTQARDTMSAFRRCRLMLPLYEEGVMGKTIRADLDELLALEDEEHRLTFFLYDRDISAVAARLPESNRSASLTPIWTSRFFDFSFYRDFEKARSFSREVFYRFPFQLRGGPTTPPWGTPFPRRANSENRDV